jgi:hypothetical protein
MRREMIVTDVTRMAAPRVCVAGFFSDDGVAVRPIMPYNSRKDITEEFLWKGDLQIVRPFAEVRLRFTSPIPDPPHTEDWEIHPMVGPQLVRFLSPEERRDFLQDHLDPSVDSIFGAPI